MTTDKHNKRPNVPPLRFPEFSGEWERGKIGDDCDIHMCKRIFADQTNDSFGVPFYKIGTIGGTPDAFISQELFELYKKSYNYPHKGEVMITCAGTVGKAIVFNGKDSYFQDSNIVWISNPTSYLSNDFLYYFINRVDWSKLNSTTITRIYNDDLRNLRIAFPSIKEQKKIAQFLSLLEQKIAVQSKLIEDLQQLKSAFRERIFYRIIKRFGRNVILSELLDYEQPAKYLISDTEYSNNSSLTPVLTANKSFILGYTEETEGIYNKGECIILDDFTLDSKYVDFPFKLKSSAIKILTAINKANLYYVYEYLQFLEMQTQEHARHYISEVSHYEISYPNDYGFVNEVASFLYMLTSKIKKETIYLKLLESQKQYLLKKMFI